MGTIIIGAFVSVFIGLVIGGICGATVGWTVVAIVGALVTLIVLLPVEGFEDKECDREYQLIPLRHKQPNTKKYYVEMKGREAIFAFDNSDEYELEGVAYQEMSAKGKIILYETEQDVEPVLKVFKKRPIREIWTLAPFSTKTEYVFFVPMGSVHTQSTVYKSDVV